MGLVKAQLRGRWRGPTRVYHPVGRTRGGPQGSWPPHRPQLPGNVCSTFGRKRAGEERRRREVRAVRDSREAEKQGAETDTHTDTGVEDRQGATRRGEEEGEGGKYRLLPGSSFSAPRTGQGCLAQGALACWAWCKVSGGPRKSIRGRRRLNRCGCRHPDPEAGSGPASGPGRRAGLRSGVGRSPRAAASSSES